MGKTITLPSAPGTAELYGKAVTALLPGIGGTADPLADLRAAVIARALPHVAFDGWSDRTLAAAVSEALAEGADGVCTVGQPVEIAPGSLRLAGPGGETHAKPGVTVKPGSGKHGSG